MELYEGKNWKVIFVSKKQKHLGRCKIVNKNYKSSLSDLTIEEWTELAPIEKELERICKKLFHATMFNFACLMNKAYKENKTPYVHFHFIPRYKKNVLIGNKIYKDILFGNNIWKNTSYKNIFDNREILIIYHLMKKEINIK